MKKILLSLGGGLAVFVFVFSASVVLAANYTLKDDATIVSGGNPNNAVQLVSDTSKSVAWGSVDFPVPADLKFSNIDTLQADYKVPVGGCLGGGPRFALKVDMNDNGIFEQPVDGHIVIYLGDAPNWSCSASDTWQNTGNLINISDSDKRYDLGQVGGTFYDTYGNTLAKLGSKKILGISFVTDGGWAVAGGKQTVLADNIIINRDVYTFDIVRSAEITFPITGSEVSGTVEFKAYLVDDDADDIQWAVRKGTCAANTSTVFGNVDGHSDLATIVSNNFAMQTFSFTGDMSTMDSGMYCFIYNPIEDNGESNIRKTVEFNLLKATPTNKDECKNGGWETFSLPEFKNQGDCVSWLQSNSKAKGNKKNN